MLPKKIASLFLETSFSIIIGIFAWFTMQIHLSIPIAVLSLPVTIYASIVAYQSTLL